MPPRARRSSSKGFAGVRAALTRKLGPLPAWAYLIALAVGLYYYRQRQAAKAAAAAAAQQAPVSITYGTQTTPGIDNTGSGSGSGGGPPPVPEPPPPPTDGGPPPPPQTWSTVIWVHGNPGHTYTYTGDPSVSAWFQLDGKWYYYSAGDSRAPTYPGGAYPQGSPYMPPDAGNPPSNASQAASSQVSTSTGGTSNAQNLGPGAQAHTITPPKVLQVNGASHAAAPTTAGKASGFASRQHTRPTGVAGVGTVSYPHVTTVRAGLVPRPRGGGGLHHPMPPLREPAGAPKPRNWFGPTTQAEKPPTFVGPRPPRPVVGPKPPPTVSTGTARTSGRGRPRPTAAYDPQQIPTGPSPSRTAAVTAGRPRSPAPTRVSAAVHVQGATARAQTRTAEATRAGTATARASMLRTGVGRPRSANPGAAGISAAGGSPGPSRAPAPGRPPTPSRAAAPKSALHRTT